MSWLSQRDLQDEIMDSPDLDPAELDAALVGLSRLNRVSLCYRLLWRPLRQLASRSPAAPLKVLDLATGRGDHPIYWARRAQAAGLDMEISGCDRNPEVIEIARKNAGDVAVRFFVHDVLQDDLPADFDVVTCSLFLHHLDQDEARSLLSRALAAARRAVLIQDLERSRKSWALTWLASRALVRSRVVHIDGLRSVEGAFTRSEVEDLAREAGWMDFQLTRHWPERMLLRSERP